MQKKEKFENYEKNDKAYIGKAKGPINIALIKYWGKADEDLIIPLNNSISLTLDTNTFYTETKVTIIPLTDSKENNNNIISLIINGKESKITSRIKKIFDKFLSLDLPICKELSTKKLNIKIESINTFPMASGCASSASSMAALVLAIASSLKLENILSKAELSKIARLGSGSACRSIYGGVCEWQKGEGDSSSQGVPLYDKNYWNLGVKLIIVNQNIKDISSSLGMKITKETSELFKYRINNIVLKHIDKLKKSFEEKDFNKLAEIVIKDSNNFHACCRDSYPSINYLNEESEYIIKSVTLLNKLKGLNICAYTFDAGSNAFIIYEMKNKNIIQIFFDKILGFDDKINIKDLLKDLQIDNKENNIKEIDKLIDKKPSKDKIIKQIDFTLGDGAQIIYE